jgi:YidC/Oxa1 family membrane protein insertase
MDKRSLLAIVATLVVLLLWQALYLGPKQREVMKRRTAAQRERAVQDSIAAVEASRETPAPAVDTSVPPETKPAETVPVRGEERRPAEGAGMLSAIVGEAPVVSMKVATDRIVVTLNSRGAEIASVRLLAFEGPDGEWVELVPPGKTGGFALALREGRERESLSGIVFEAVVNGETITGDREFEIAGSTEPLTITFRANGPGGPVVEKRYTFRNGAYEVGLSVSIGREDGLQRSDAFDISWDCGMAVTEGVARSDLQQFAAMARLGEEYYKETLRKFGKETEKIKGEAMVVWAGAKTKYFLSAIIPERQRSGSVSLEGNSAEGFIGYSVQYPFRGDPRLVEENFVCYLGPLDMDALKTYGVGLEKTIDLGRLRFLSVFVLNFMTFLKRFIPNYGVIIIILSVLTKVLFYRLTHKSFKSMKDMQRLQPRIKELQEKYRDNKQKMNEEMMRLYKEAGVNPLGGCLPLLLQMPIFIALFNVLRNTIELRKAPFALWINDLSSPDTLFRFGVSLPFVGNEFHLLPILMGAAMVLQSKMGASPTGEAAPATQTKMMSTLMPIIFTVFFYSMPSGLVIYWFVNNVLTIVQQYYVHKEVEREEVESMSVEAADAKQTNDQDPRGNRGARTGAEKRAKKGTRGNGGEARRKTSKRRSYH